MFTSSASLKNALKYKKGSVHCIKTSPRVSSSVKLSRKYYTDFEYVSNFKNIFRNWIFKDKALAYNVEKQRFVVL